MPLLTIPYKELQYKYRSVCYGEYIKALRHEPSCYRSDKEFHYFSSTTSRNFVDTNLTGNIIVSTFDKKSYETYITVIIFIPLVIV